MADDAWKDGVPPSPEGVTPAQPSGTAAVSTNATSDPFQSAPVARLEAPSAPPVGYAPGPPAPPYDPTADARPAAGGVYDPMPAPPAPPNTSKNWMGIVALVLGIAGGGILAFVFGGLGIRAANRGEATNKGMARAGIIVAAAWLALGGVLGATLGFGSVLSPGPKAFSDVVPGDCYVTDPYSEAVSVDVADMGFGDCTEDKNGQVYYVSTVPEGAAPGDAGFDDALYDACVTDAAIARVDVEIASEYWVEQYYPQGLEWTLGERWLICGMVNEYGPVSDAALN